MIFTESNTVEFMIRDLLCGAQPAASKIVADLPAPYIPTGLAHRGAGWHYVPAAALPRQPQDVFVESFVREALIRLNPDIAAQPERADEVLAARMVYRRVTSPARAVNDRGVRSWRRPMPGTYWPV